MSPFKVEHTYLFLVMSLIFRITEIAQSAISCDRTHLIDGFKYGIFLQAGINYMQNLL